MFCRNCGSQLPDDASFCPECGATLAQSAGSEPGQADTPSPTASPPRKPKLKTWHKALIIAGAVIVVAAIALGAIYGFGLFDRKDDSMEVFLTTSSSGHLEAQGVDRIRLVVDEVWDIVYEIDGKQFYELEADDFMDEPTDVKIIFRDLAANIISTGRISGLMVINTDVEDEIDWDDYTQAETLLVRDSEGLVELLDIAELKAVRFLYLQNCEAIEDLDDLGSMQLQKLFIDNMSLTDLDGLAEQSDLTLLSLDDIEGLDDLKTLADLNKLQTLLLDDVEADRADDLDMLEGSSSLRFLEIRSCDWLDDLSALDSLGNLQTLMLSNMSIDDLDDLEQRNNLKRLMLEQLFSLDSLDPLSELKSLETLTIFEMPMDDFDALSNLTRLQELRLVSTGFSDISDIQGLTELESLTLANLPVESLVGLEKLPKLSRLLLSGLKDTEDISTLSEMKKLDMLALWSFQPEILDDLPALEDLETLWLINIAAEDIRFLDGFDSLSELVLNLDLESVSGLEKLTGIRTLTLAYMRLEDVEALFEMRQLKTLVLRHMSTILESVDDAFDDLEDQGILVIRDRLTDQARIVDEFNDDSDGGGATEETTEATETEVTITETKPQISQVRLLLPIQNSPDFDAFIEGAIYYTEENSRFEMIVTDAGGESSQQTALILSAPGDGMEAIVVWPFLFEDAAASLDELSAAGFPAVVALADPMNFPNQLCVYINHYEYGLIAANMSGGMVDSGKAVAIVSGMENIPVLEERQAGFIDTMADLMPGATILDPLYIDFDPVIATESVKELLDSNPDIQLIFADCAMAGQGAVNAISELGLNDQVSLIVLDANSGVISGLEDGSVDLLVMTDHWVIGYESMNAIAGLIDGTDDRDIQVDPHVITPENMEDFELALEPYR